MYQFILELLKLFTITCVWSIVLFAVIWAPHVVFHKFKVPVTTTNEFPPFSMLDGAVLVTYLCFGFAAISWMDDSLGVRSFVQSYLLLFFVVSFLAFMIWVMNLRFMKFNNIVQPKGRAIFQFILYPLSVLSVTGLPIIGMTLAFQLLGETRSGTQGTKQLISILASTVAFTLAAVTIPITRRLYQKYCLEKAELATDSWKPF